MLKKIHLRIRQLERALGNKTLKVEILKESVCICREKNLSQGCPYTAWRISSKKVTEALTVSRQLIASGHSPVNHKRIYRIMCQSNLLLARFTGSRPGKAHTGKVATMQRNQRWRTDGFEIACNNGERVRVIFALDACDREVMAFSASTDGYSADMALNVMLACVEKRFGDIKTFYPVECLSDNDSRYTARETIAFAAQLGIISKFTPVRSPKAMASLKLWSKHSNVITLSVMIDLTQIL